MSDFQGFNEHYHKELQEEIASLETVLFKGNIDYEEYKRIVGKRQGLLYALERHKELITLMEQARDR